MTTTEPRRGRRRKPADVSEAVAAAAETFRDGIAKVGLEVESVERVNGVPTIRLRQSGQASGTERDLSEEGANYSADIPEDVLEGDVEDAPSAPEQGELPGMETPTLWPRERGYRIDRVDVTVSGGVQLGPLRDIDRELAARLLRLGTQVRFSALATVDRRGHKVLRDHGQMTGIAGVATLTVVDLVEQSSATSEMYRLQERVLNAVLALLELQGEMNHVEMPAPDRARLEHMAENVRRVLEGFDPVEEPRPVEVDEDGVIVEEGEEGRGESGEE